MTTEYTPNFRFNMPDFRMGPWHDLMNTNTFRLDQILLAIYQGVDTAPWENNKLYTPGQTAIDLSDNSFWVCAFEHTSAPAPTTFAADRAANPTFWIRTVVGITPRGQWQNATHYLVNDMVSDADQGVIAICTTEHDSIVAPGTIRDDAAFWTFIVDMTGSGANQAAYIVYDNSTSGTTQTNLQGTTDEIYDRLATIDGNIILIGTAVADLDTRVDALEISDAAQDAAITTLQSNDTNQETRLTAVEGTVTGHETRITNLETDTANDLEDAPSDGEIYARQNAAWVVVSGGGASVLVSDTPPVGADPNSLWWESDTGQLYILYDDGDTTQWVVAVPQLDAGSFVAKSGDTMTGPLVLAADPVADMQAATRQFVMKYSEFNFAVAAAAGALTISLKNCYGNDPSAAAPVVMKFPTGTGTDVWRTITAALSVVIPSGATLGWAVNGFAYRLWMAAFDDAGTVRLAVRTCSSHTGNFYTIVRPPEFLAYTTLSPPANALHQWYTSTGAIASGKFWKFIGFADWNAGLAAVGTWVVPSLIQKLDERCSFRPGDVVQRFVDIAASAGTLSAAGNGVIKTTTYQMVSACNFTRQQAEGYVYLRTAVAGGQGGYQFYRNGVSISAAMAQRYTAITQDTIGWVNTHCWDRPSAIGTFTYDVRGVHAGAAGTVQYQLDSWQIEEMMG